MAMGKSSVIESDYLVVGAGALGMGFVDTLIQHSDADVLMIDRRHGPGGHWLDSYPFVQLHQPSMNYGVNSTALGDDRTETEGRDAGFYERASGTEICRYYDEIMRYRLLASGRVHFFPMCDYLGGRRFRSRFTGLETAVSVRRSVVDATYMASHVPATDPPPFEVSDMAQCIPVGALTSVTGPPAGYVVIGGGKTAMDAVCWLLDKGAPAQAITWIRPRDSWILNRSYFQPGDCALSRLGQARGVRIASHATPAERARMFQPVAYRVTHLES
jgi:NAD(P)-binding Rossmann-like domain